MDVDLNIFEEYEQENTNKEQESTRSDGGDLKDYDCRLGLGVAHDEEREIEATMREKEREISAQREEGRENLDDYGFMVSLDLCRASL
ncbi:hypothetical protein DY000_02060785 [Brassica cretica]|uniref:Uncharacterized protein n=1 Tax=Brassica cretica TaxID=69181 RepID=A0ABQ7AUC9_BRACR|nr:hypothetical protein DY000_02060785 [Brassica cretica]